MLESIFGTRVCYNEGFVNIIPKGHRGWQRRDTSSALLTTKAGGPKWDNVKYRTTYLTESATFLEDARDISEIRRTKQERKFLDGQTAHGITFPRGPVGMVTTLWFPVKEKKSERIFGRR